MEVTGYDDLGIISPVPVLRLLGAAPQNKPRRAGDLDEILSQRPVVDDDQGDASGRGRLQLGPGLLDQHIAPCLAGGMRIRMQDKLVGGDGILLLGPLQGFCLGVNVVRAERVVVQGEDGCNERRASLAFPEIEVVLGGMDAVLSGYSHTLVVLFLATQLRLGRGGEGVEFMVSWTPKDLFEALGGGGKGQLEVGGFLAHVADQDQAIVEMQFQFRPELAVGWVAEVNVSYSVETHVEGCLAMCTVLDMCSSREDLGQSLLLAG